MVLACEICGADAGKKPEFSFTVARGTVRFRRGRDHIRVRFPPHTRHQLFKLPSEFREFQTLPLQFHEFIKLTRKNGLIAAGVHQQGISPFCLDFRQARCGCERDGKVPRIRIRHSAAHSFGKGNKTGFLFRRVIAGYARPSFSKRRTHSHSRILLSCFEYMLSPLLVGDSGNSLLCNLLLHNRKRTGCRRHCVLQPGIRCFVLTKPRHDARVEFGALVIFSGRKKFIAGNAHALLGKRLSGFQKIPGFKPASHFEILPGALWRCIDQRGLKRADGIGVSPLPCADFRDFFHPLRIFIGELV